MKESVRKESRKEEASVAQAQKNSSSLSFPAVGPYQIDTRSENSGSSIGNAVQRLKKPIQFVRTAPAVTGNAVIAAGPVNAPNRDTVAPGPTNVDAYTITTGAGGAAANRDAAMAHIRTEYTAIGQGFAAPGGGVTGVFLYGTGLRNRTNADRPTAAVIYDALLAAGNIVAHAAGAAATPQQKQTHLMGIAPRPELLPANMEVLKNNAAIPWHDPVEVNISAAYGAAAPLELRIDFTEGQKGYITRVQDPGVDAEIADRPNYAGEFPRAHALTDHYRVMGGLNSSGIDDFSNVHHTNTVESAATQIGRLGAGVRTTRSRWEAGIDAITKVVAEGGRFNCVAALGTAIRNDSLFFAVNPAGGVRTVEFRELWKMWQNRFGGAYGVADAAVVTFITGGAAPPANVNQVAAAPAPTGFNYDLDNNAVS